MIKQGIFFTACLILACSCKYQRGDLFLSKNQQQDSMLYVVALKGQGNKISEKAGMLKQQHEMKGNACVIKYFTDSTKLVTMEGVMLFNSYLPEIKQDMLSKGYFGTFTSKQHVTYLLVSYEDLDKSFIKTKHKKKEPAY
jgi:hypothetical protein